MIADAPAAAPDRDGLALDPVAGVRVPALPASMLAALFAQPDLELALFELLAQRGDVYHVLKLASSSLGGGIDRWLGDPNGDHRRCAGSALTYLARCAMRATPLAACATVSLARLGDGGEPLTVAAEIRTRTRADADWVYEAAAAHERRPDAVAALLLRAAGNAFVIGERLEVLDAARTEMRGEDDRAAVAPPPTALNFTPAVRAALEHARAPVTGRALARRIGSLLDVPEAAALELVAKLVELGVLVTELRVPLVREQVAALAESVRRVDADAGRRLDGVRAALAAVDDAPFAERAERLAALAPEAAAFANTKQFYQIDATRDVGGTVPVAFANTVADAFRALARMTPPNPHARRLAELFAEKYNEGREVPLLRLLEARQSFDFETAIAKLPAQRLADDVQEELLALASTAAARGERVVALDALLPLLAAPHDGIAYADSYETLAHVLRGDGASLVPGLWSGFHAGAGRSLTRFADLLGEDVGDVLRRGVRPAPGCIDAELSSLPRMRRSINVMTRDNPFAYELVDGLWPAGDPERTLTPDDLVVGLAGGRLYVRSERHGAIVRVHQSHLARQTGNSRLGTFLATIAQSDLPYVAFTWGAAAVKLPFKPRVTVAGAVVAPATWRVPADVARDFAGPAGIAWRALWHVPRRVYLVQLDNRALLDLNHAACVAQIAGFAARAGTRSVELHEPLPDLSDVTVDGPGGRHVAEVALALHVPAAMTAAPPAPRIGAARVTPAFGTQFAPGTQWIYARCYLPFERAGYFIEREIGALLRELGAAYEDAHFVRYRDPDPHVRLRVRAASAGTAAALWSAVVARGNGWVRAGAIERFELGTYDREVERYGGTAAIELAERVFTADTALVLGALREHRTAAQPLTELVLDVARTMLCLCGGLAGAVAWSKSAFGRRPRLDAHEWSAIKAARERLGGDGARYAELAARVREYHAAVPEHDRARVTRALLHMHCNRAGIVSA
ncbi:MAG: lantibiotic biosynthesis protein, partial [Candidatus Eremiobacteraeota bacterium]|nr:lantibiotic biosynthesis protein [Candidatus Eremiobacteraeota bacterium]